MPTQPASDFRPLYRATAVAIFMMLIMMVLQILVFVLKPPPNTVQGLFALFQENVLLGLLSLDLLYVVNNAILVLIYSALYIWLRQAFPVSTLLALLFGIIGVACYYPSNPAFEMLTLSEQYWQAGATQQTLYLAAGEALMAGYTGTSFNAYYVFSTLSLLLFASACFKCDTLPRAAGISGLIAGFFMLVPSSAGKLGMVFALLSLLPWALFITLLMIRFHQVTTKKEIS